MLQKGNIVSEFSTTTETGDKVSSKSLLGKKYVLYFYPKDDTPGCTREACNIRDNYSEFSKLDVAIYGVSGGSAISHQKFIQKYKLPFPLLMDSNFEMAKSFGAYREGIFSWIGLGVMRVTFIIDENGFVEKVFDKVDVGNHARELIQYFKNN